MANKYGVSVGTLIKRANTECWAKSRENAYNRSVLQVEQKVANAASENAAIAQRIKAKLLRKLEKEIDSLPENVGSETRNSLIEKTHEKGKTKMKEATKAYKLRDLTAAYRDLTEDMNLNTSNEQVRIIVDV